MKANVAEASNLRAENINLRVSRRQKTLIDSAADSLGRNRSDRCYFSLGDNEFQRFTDLLDNPPSANPKLARLLQRKPSWEQ